jgi:cob(I)alamin adenosyltransferase
VQDRLGRLVELVAAATAELACPTADARSTLPRTVGEADVRQLEQIVDEVRGRIAIPPSFLYSAHGVAALLNVARTVARRAERRFVTLQRGEPAENRHLQPLLNRLCDAIFALTRFAEAGEEADNP